MSNHFSRQLATLRHNERGQVAILMVMVLPVIFLFFALALDAGLWFLDHRLAQNQADAAVLAAVQHLPAADPGPGSPPTKAVHKWLKKNGSNPGQLKSCPESIPPPDLVIAKGGLEYWDLHPASFPDGKYDTVRVCVRRESPSFFAKLAGLNGIYVSAGATARVGPAGIANVLPWGIVPPDPDCGIAWPDVCENEFNEACGYHPPILPGQELCPWGLDVNKLYAFKISDPEIYTPGNFGALASCGVGISDYRKCIQGETNSGFYAEGQTVNVGAQTGVGGANTNAALNTRYAAESTIGFGAGGTPVLECDIEATPNPITGLDPDGKAAARAKFVIDPDDKPGPGPKVVHNPICENRLVVIPIIKSFPSSGSSEDILVLGIATFAIAKWDRIANPDWGDALGTDSPTGACGTPTLVSGFGCGMVWGYLMEGGVQPPHFLLQRISESENGLAPNMIALVE